jgi:peptidoglycan glycosyltransferase
MMVNKRSEYVYLHLVLAFGLSGYMSLSIHSKIVSNLIWPTLILISILYLTYYFISKILKEKNLLFIIVTFMVVMGWLMLLRLHPGVANKQLLWIILGCFVLLLLLKFLNFFSNDFILKYKLYWIFLTFILLLVPLILGIEVGGAKSWLEISGLRVQPSEAAKLSFLVFLASWFKEHNKNTFKDTWLVWVGTFICLGLLVLQRDLGTALVFYLAFIFLLYLATGKLDGPLIGLFILIMGGVLAYLYFPHVKIRIISWLNPWLNPDRGGYQILQSLFAFSSGGIVGMGLGGGIPGIIPEAHTDFLFAVIGEQLGLLGTIGIVILYLFFTFFSLKRAQLIPTLGSRLLASGLTLVIIVQAFVIMGGVTKLIPLTGLPLPFMSYGGSSTLSNFAMLGIIIWLGKEKGFVPAVTRRRLITINRLIWVMFLALIINLSFWQVLKAQPMIENPLNPRWRLVEKFTSRGLIYAADGSLLAGNSQNLLGREYPLGEASAHIVGYSSLKYGKTGLENSLNSYLLAIPEVKPGFLSQNRQGWHVYTTINPKLQKLAWLLHKEKPGASIIMDVKKGDILALVSSPSFDPNKILDDWPLLRESQWGNLFNRATQGLYPPGSVFKIVTGTTLIQLKPDVIKGSTSLPSEIEADGYQIKDLIYRPSLTFAEALGYSSNVFFVKHYLNFSWQEIKERLNKSFQIDRNYSSKDLPVIAASLGEIRDKADIASTIIGQGEVVVTPMHIAIWTSAIANGGIILQPRIVDKIVDENNSVIEKRKPRVLGQVCSKEEAQNVIKGLKFAVEHGTATKAKIAGIKIGGKTGTAENSHGQTHAWFVGIAPLTDPQIVVVTIVEHGGRGGDTAAPIARSLLKAALE